MPQLESIQRQQVESAVEVRRRLFSWSYLEEGRDARKKYFELLRKETSGRLTNADKFERLLLSVFDFRSKLDLGHLRCSYVLQDFRQRADSVRTTAVCDCCHNRIYDTPRIVCMNCGSRSTFDFCDKPECLGCTIKTRDDITSPHLPTHDLVKASILYHREIGKVLRNAKAGLERAQKLLQQQDEEKDGSEGLVSFSEKKVTPEKQETTMAFTVTCLRCDGLLRSRPCWYCIDCPQDNIPFICWDCDEREAASFSHGEHHRAMHNLVRCMEGKESTSENDKTEKRLDAVDHKLEELTSQIEGLVSQVERLNSQIEDRMERVENILRSLRSASDK
ncbi:hypothetical protein LXA43DRAFT_1099745 [Ganoderma leucocontextum]|nr:hypothetical protein LXA43DRAFT_1099745 [Ganoderma leucocontextum]